MSTSQTDVPSVVGVVIYIRLGEDEISIGVISVVNIECFFMNTGFGHSGEGNQFLSANAIRSILENNKSQSSYDIVVVGIHFDHNGNREGGGDGGRKGTARPQVLGSSVSDWPI